MPDREPPAPSDGWHVAVVGGGVAGLVAARRLAESGIRVTVFEAGPRLGGQVLTVPFVGHRVDVGAEALHLGAPAVAALVDELGLTGRLVRSRPGAAWIWTESGLRTLPAGVGPGGPTRLGPVLRSRVLSPAGVARAALEPLLPRTRVAPDIGVGDYLARRFGSQVCDRLVDPVLGALHAGDVHRLSLHAASPQLASTADRHRSLLLAHRARRSGGVPAFATFRAGLVTLVDALAAHPSIAVRPATPVVAVRPAPPGFEVDVGGGESVVVDGVVVALPAGAARRLLAPVVPLVDRPLSALSSVSVTTVLAAYPSGSVAGVRAFAGTGLLVPSGRRRMLKAATFLGRKWPHLVDDDWFLVRMSAGRAGGPTPDDLDDAELVARLHEDLADATGVLAPPAHTQVVRWPGAMAQLEVGHRDRLGAIRAALAGLPGLALAGAPFDGVGIASCVASGERAASAVEQDLVRGEALAR